MDNEFSIRGSFIVWNEKELKKNILIKVVYESVVLTNFFEYFPSNSFYFFPSKSRLSLLVTISSRMELKFIYEFSFHLQKGKNRVALLSLID